MLRLSLRTKLIIAALLVLTPVVLLLAQNYRAAYDNQRNLVLADEVRVAQVVSAIVDDNFAEALAIVRSYATDPVVLSFDPPRINQYLARLAPLYPQYDDVVAVFDARGNIVGSARGVGPVNVADRKWFQDVLRTGEAVVSDVLISRETGRPIVGVAVPINDQTGQRVGAVGSALDLDHLPRTLETVQGAMGQQIFMADRTGRIAFHTGKPDLRWAERDASGYLPVRTALEGKLFVGEVPDSLLGDQRMVVATATPQYGWVVGISIPVDAALAPVRDAVRDGLIIFAGVVAISIGLALLMAQFLSRPLRRLTEYAVALGRGELGRRVKITTGDELERLGDSFDAMADEVQRALRLRDEFLGVASHELRTPLTVIKAYAQWLLTRETDQDKRGVLQIMVRHADRIDELLREMLTVSELRAGRVELHPQRFDLAALVREVVTGMQTLSEKHRLLLRVDGPAMVDADRDQIEVVLTHLIDNAIRYSPKGGDVEATVAKGDGQVVVAVKDQGIGIPEERQRHVFEPFFQIQPAIAGYGGMGLGLYISKEILQRHGGRIWFESKEGQGSTFYFSLPLPSPQ